MDKKKHLLITGKIGSGKSTLISKILIAQNEPVYGFFTKKEKPDSSGICHVYIHDPNQPRKYTKENCVGVCTIGGSIGFSNIFDHHAFLLNNIPEGSLVVMDELGTMESEASLFCSAVLSILDENFRVIASLKCKDSPFLNAIRNHSGAKLYSINTENRESLYKDILQDPELGFFFNRVRKLTT